MFKVLRSRSFFSFLSFCFTEGTRFLKGAENVVASIGSVHGLTMCCEHFLVCRFSSIGGVRNEPKLLSEYKQLNFF